MRAQSKDIGLAGPGIRLALAAAFVVTLTAWTGAQAQEQPRNIASAAEAAAQNPPADSSQALTGSLPGELVVVGESSPHSEPWADFRETVAGAAVPSCFEPGALSHQEFAAEGLLRAPLLVAAAANDRCR